MRKLRILPSWVGLNILQLRDRESVSSEESRLKKQGYPLSCSKSLAISLETVLPEGTWMTQIGRTLPRIVDFRSVLSLDHNEIWINYQYLLCQQTAILPFRTLFAANPRQFSLVLVEGMWISLDFTRCLVGQYVFLFHQEFSQEWTCQEGKWSMVQRWVTVQTLPGCELMHWVGWMNAMRYPLCGYIYIYKLYRCL